VVIEKRPVPDVAAQYGVSRSWLYELLARYRVEGEAAFEARSRRPDSSPDATPAATVDLIIELRQKLTATGLDAGPETIGWHLQHHHGMTISRATVARRLAAAGLVTPEPKKRPRSSYTRFAAEQPNECWQADFTHYRLTRPDGRPGADTEILSWLDDRSRYALSITAHHRVTGPIVVAEFGKAVATHGIPASTLTDNGMVFTTRLSGGSLRGTRGRNGLETELNRLGVLQKNSRPNHQTTCGQYNHHRPHRSLPHRATPQPPTRPAPRPPPATTAPRAPTPQTASVPTESTRPERSPCDTAAGSTPSASAEPTPEPASSSRSTTSTSASSTPQPASSSANSPPTQPSDTKAPANRPAPPAKPKTAEPTTIGFGRPRCPETSHRSG